MSGFVVLQKRKEQWEQCLDESGETKMQGPKRSFLLRGMPVQGDEKIVDGGCCVWRNQWFQSKDDE